jgi:hypothetical protein
VSRPLIKVLRLLLRHEAAVEVKAVVEVLRLLLRC